MIEEARGGWLRKAYRNGPDALHVRVAAALGWTGLHWKLHETCPCCGFRGDITLPTLPGEERWGGRAPGDDRVGVGACHATVPFYHSDWSVTGPLIERYRIAIYFPLDLRNPRAADAAPIAVAVEPDEARPEHERMHWCGRTPLEAVCGLVVWLHEQGRLPR